MTSKIPWLWPEGMVGETYNPTVGCQAIGPGCLNCYAARLAGTRLKQLPLYEGLATKIGGRYQWTGEVRRATDKTLGQPYRWKKPRMIFVGSMTDLFYEEQDPDTLYEIFDILARTPQHRYVVLTKRPSRAKRFIEAWCEEVNGPIPSHIYIGVSGEDQTTYLNRWGSFSATHKDALPPEQRVLSLEPVIGPIALEPPYPAWTIIGGESGARARRFDPKWMLPIISTCVSMQIPVFVKQMGSAWAKDVGAKDLAGSDISEWHEHLGNLNYLRREFPEGMTASLS